MAQNPTRRPDSAKPLRPDLAKPQIVGAAASSASVPSENNLSPLSNESDLAALAARFEGQGQGKISAELAAELALEIVLNEIVQQACAATGANGAAIALRRGAEMVCRASSGDNAPPLGTGLDTNSGLSGACLRSAQIQSCDDAWNDPRADAKLSQRLGIRSVVVYPLLAGRELLGILEVFSDRPKAFGAGDLQTLEAWAGGVLKNLQASQAWVIARERGSIAAKTDARLEKKIASETVQKPAAGVVIDSAPKSEEASLTAALPVFTAYSTAYRAPSAKRFDWFAAAAGAIIFSIAVVMGTVLIVRVGWLKVGGNRSMNVARPGVSAQTSNVSPAVDKPAASSGAPGSAAVADGKPANTKSPIGQSGTHADAPRDTDGTLLVYQDGKEIFRMPAVTLDAIARTKSAPAGTIATLSPDAARSDLVQRVEPAYPAQALSQHVQGAVVLHVRTGREGAVEDVQVVSGNPLLADAAVAAVLQWRFKPRFVNGEAVAMETEVTLRFTLPSD
jgi:TonB family protein